MAEKESLQQSRLMLEVTRGREHRSEHGQEVMQVLIKLLYLLLLFHFPLFIFSPSSLSNPDSTVTCLVKVGMLFLDHSKEHQKLPHQRGDG